MQARNISEKVSYYTLSLAFTDIEPRNVFNTNVIAIFLWCFCGLGIVLENCIF